MESCKNEETKSINKKKILVCGLVSGILTKTLFAPLDRIKLFYQIQPMFYQCSVDKKIHNLKIKKRSIKNNLLLNNIDNKTIKTYGNLSASCLTHKKFITKNYPNHNFKSLLYKIINTNENKNKNKRHMKKWNTKSISTNYNAASKCHKIFNTNLFNYTNKLKNVYNLRKKYLFLNNININRRLRNKLKYFNEKKIANNGFKYENIMQSAMHIIKEEGVLGLWKGNLINTIRGGIVYSAKFGTNDLVKENYKKKKKRESNKIHNEDNTKKLKTYQNGIKDSNHMIKKEKINYYESVVAGYAAGVIQKTMSYPLDLLSIRMALGINEKYLRNSLSCKKKSILKMISEISKNEGLSGFFKGFFPTLLTGVPYVTLQMLFFDFYKNQFQNYKSQKSNSVASVAFYSSISGSLSNLSALIIVFPGDTVRKRMMSNGIDNKNYIYRNSFHCIKNIYYYESFKSFYFGLFPSMLKSIPSGAIQFMSYEILKYILSQKST